MKEINLIYKSDEVYLFESEGHALICTSEDEQITVPDNVIITVDFGSDNQWTAKNGKWSELKKDEVLKKECGKYFWERKYMWVLSRRKEILNAGNYICYPHELYAKRMMKYSDKLLYS